MTNDPRPVPAPSSVPPRRGFTLIELMVVVGVVVLIAGLSLVGINKARVRAKATKTASDLQAIAVALDAYKADFGDYPRPAVPPWTPALAGAPSWSPDYPLIGGQTLCKALLSPGPAATPGTPTGPYHKGDFYGADAAGAADYICLHDTTAAPPTADWAPLSTLPVDGVAGPGFATRTGTPPHQPYLNAETFPIVNDIQGFTLMDGYGHPILYCPAALNRGTLHIAVANASGPQPYVDSNGLAAASASLYDADFIAQDFVQPGDSSLTPAVNRIRTLLGDKSDNGVVDPGETAAATGPYLLWSAGDDGTFGPDTNGKSDDVTNFDIPAELRK